MPAAIVERPTFDLPGVDRSDLADLVDVGLAAARSWLRSPWSVVALVSLMAGLVLGGLVGWLLHPVHGASRRAWVARRLRRARAG